MNGIFVVPSYDDALDSQKMKYYNKDYCKRLANSKGDTYLVVEMDESSLTTYLVK
jgi:hypothetical protein